MKKCSQQTVDVFNCNLSYSNWKKIVERENARCWEPAGLSLILRNLPGCYQAAHIGQCEQPARPLECWSSPPPLHPPANCQTKLTSWPAGLSEKAQVDPLPISSSHQPVAVRSQVITNSFQEIKLSKYTK